MPYSDFLSQGLLAVVIGYIIAAIVVTLGDNHESEVDRRHH